MDKFLPELDCRYEYNDTITISINQIAHRDIEWTFELLVSVNRGYDINEIKVINTPILTEVDATKALVAAKQFAERWVRDNIIV